MRIHILGTGTPTPSPDRFGSAFIVQLGDRNLMVDCGPAATHKMVKAGLWPTHVTDLFFTHHHSTTTSTTRAFSSVAGTSR